MATYGKKLLDSNNNVILPKTRSNLVYMNNNETVEDEINGILTSISNLKKISAITDNTFVLDYGKGLVFEFGRMEKSFNTTQASGSGMFISFYGAGFNFKTTFASPPVLILDFNTSNTYAGVFAIEVTETAVNGLTFYRGTSTSGSGILSYLAIGKKA